MLYEVVASVDRKASLTAAQANIEWKLRRQDTASSCISQSPAVGDVPNFAIFSNVFFIGSNRIDLLA